VTEIPGVELPAVTVAEIRRAGRVLSEQGWKVEEAQPPELGRITEVWGYVMGLDMAGGNLDEMRAVVSAPLIAFMEKMRARFADAPLTNPEIHAERSRLNRLWSQFLTEYPVAIGPTWSCLPWPIDSDMNPDTGLDTFVDTVGFITPGNLLALPSVALPTGVADGLATGIQIYADMWREDLCLGAAELIEAQCDMPTPIDPVRL